ncbi:MAG TPA: uracil-DNA glycosylase [Pseudogracilibacillus sp.]|nr:uracil-DNA glycosylase [Pseudogracilibacillus sp.]
MINLLTNDWAHILNSEFNKPYFKDLDTFLNQAYQQETIYPAYKYIFNALNLTAYQDVKVVILGQDPYHGPNQAHGLSFSVKEGNKLPPSLKNIFKELTNDLSINHPSSGDLTAWANQGVLLLNAVLTVESGKANSHKNKGWEKFTDTIISKLNDKEHPIVYILWGAAAQQKIKLIDTTKHFIIKSVHPSPLSSYRGFFGSKPFSKTNQILHDLNLSEINWALD